jgi:hypothetical protein
VWEDATEKKVNGFGHQTSKKRKVGVERKKKILWEEQTPRRHQFTGSQKEFERR